MLELSRRKALTVGAAVAMGAKPAAAAPIGLPPGLELYTVAKEMEADFEGTLRAIAAIGYRHVESVATTYGSRGPRQVRQFLGSLGLGWTSTHTSVRDLQTKADKIISDAA